MRKTVVCGVAAGAAALLVGCGGSSRSQLASASLPAPPSTPPATPAAIPLPAAAGGASVVTTLPGSPGETYPESLAGPLQSVSRRVAGPVTLRLFTTAPVAGQACDPSTSQCVPDWCQPTSQLALELSTDAIAMREITSNIGVGPGSSLSLLSSASEGTDEGHPVQVVIAKVAEGVDRVELATATGSDIAAPEHGLVALAVSDSQPAGTVIAYDGAGKVLQRLQVPAPVTQSSADCQPQPIKLPVPGKQPVDRALAVEQVRAAFTNAFTHAPPGGDIYHGLATVQGGGELRDSVDQVRRNFPTAFDTITVAIGDLVFTDPTHAVVQFTPSYEQGAPYGEQNGTAVLAGGTWLVTQSTYCSLLRFGGATCP